MVDDQTNQEDIKDQPSDEKDSVVTKYLGLKLADVSAQVMDETKVSEKFMRPWRETKRKYLKLYINQRKNPKKVGDTLMFSTHQTILASLYKDRLDAEWMWREEEDIDRAEELNATWEFDYDEMGKPSHDYGKYWDATWFGIAVEDWSHFDRDSLTPIPDLWDPLSILPDPKCTSINGNRLGRGATRFFYREVIRTRQEMDDHGGFINLDKLDADEKKLDEIRLTQQARDEARGLETTITDVQKNRYYVLYQGYTWIDGKRYLVEAGNKGNTVVRLQAVKTDYWPLNEARVYPDPHTLLTPGCPDFTEDKQRARAIIQNYTLDAAKLDVLPMYLFDKGKIKNKSQLRDWKAGKMIEGEGVDGNTIIPLNKPSIHGFSQAIMQELETNAQKALATPELQQGVLYAQKRSATEIAEASANVDTRYSLTASLFAHSEENAAYMWYDQYKRNFKKGIDKKTVRLIGAFGPKPLPISFDSFKFKRDPDVKIESRVISQARKKDLVNKLLQYGQIMLQTPGASIRSFAKFAGRQMFSKAQVDMFLPPTVDEMKAESENELINDNKLEGVVNGLPMKVEVDPTDDHATHMEIHGKSADTKAKFAHIEAHKRAMMLQRTMPELFPPLQPQQPGQPPQIQPLQGIPQKPQGTGIGGSPLPGAVSQLRTQA
jgi:hypothetical protein